MLIKKPQRNDPCGFSAVGAAFLVRVARFERAASSSQSWRPTNWATPGNMKFAFALILYHARRCGQACGHEPFFQRNAGRGRPPRPQQNKGFPGFAPSPLRRARTRSQSTRAVNCATPGNSSEETRDLPFPPGGENCTSAPSFFLSKSNPLPLGFDLAFHAPSADAGP